MWARGSPQPPGCKPLRIFRFAIFFKCSPTPAITTSCYHPPKAHRNHRAEDRRGIYWASFMVLEVYQGLTVFCFSKSSLAPPERLLLCPLYW